MAWRTATIKIDGRGFIDTMRMRAPGPNRIGKKKKRNHLNPETGRGYNELKISEGGTAGIGEHGKIGICSRCGRQRLVGPLTMPADERWCVGGCKKKK